MNMNELADLIAKKMDTEVEEVYTEEQESDAGFSLVNGYGLQLAPYMPNPYIVSMFQESTGCIETLGQFKTEEDFISFFDNEIK